MSQKAFVEHKTDGMTVTVFPPERLRERREIRRLEEAVRQNNLPSIGSSAAFRRDDFIFPRSRDEQRFRDVPLDKTEVPEAWTTLIAKGLCLAIFIAFCIVGLPLITG